MHTKVFSILFLGSSRTSRSVSIGWISLVCAVIAGSTSITFAKELSGTFSPMSLLIMSESIVLIFTILSFGFIPLLGEITSIKKKYIPALITVGITNSIVAPLLVFTGLHLSHAVNAELFLRSYSLFMFLYAAIFLKERITHTDMLALLCMAIGICVVTLRGFTEDLTISTGDILILSGAIVYAIGAIVFKKKLHKVHPEVVLCVRGIIALSFFFLLSPFVEIRFVHEMQSLSVGLFGVLLGYGFISRFLYMFGFYESMERLPVHTVALFLPLITVGSLTFAHFRLGEAVEWYHMVGALFLITGSIIMQLSVKHLKDKVMSYSNRHHV